MLATVYLLVTGLAGFAVATRVAPAAPAIVRVPAGFLLSIVFTSWTTYLVAIGLSGATDHSLKVGMVVSMLLGAGILAKWGRSIRPRQFKLPLIDAGVTAFGLALSSWLMHAHFREEDGQLVVSANTWGDMGLHVALARSFSVGGNYPTEYPFFSGDPIRYHFGFDFFAGVLQEGGFSVLHSFNVPGVLGFTSMILLTFATARLLFSPKPKEGETIRTFRDKGVWAGLVAVSLLVTNQSLGWERYLQADGGGSISKALKPSVLWDHKDYLTGGPYTDDRIAMFNTLNPYLTQMHLIVAVAVVLLFAWTVIWQLQRPGGPDRRVLIGVGVAFGFSFWLNGVVWLATAVFLGTMLAFWGLAAARAAAQGKGETADEEKAESIDAGADTGATSTANAAVDPSETAATPEAAPSAGETVDGRTTSRAQLVKWAGLIAAFAVPALMLGVPQAMLLNGGGTSGGLKTHLSYLVCNSTSSSCHESGSMNLLSLADWWSFVEYWWLNEGLFIPLLVVAFVLGNGRDRKILGAVTCVFLWGSIFYVGEDIGGQNHKVINLWEDFGGLFAAYAVVQLWIIAGRLVRGGAGKKVAGVASRFAVICGFVFLTMTGLIDFMTVKNDFAVSVFGDQNQVETMDWIKDETPLKATFLTDYDQLYTAPTMAGRGIALGYTSWVASAGYDAEPRKTAINEIYAAPDTPTACRGLQKLDMDYVVVGPQERSSPRFKINAYLFSQMKPAKVVGSGDQQYLVYKVADNC